jgi:hypothetical protein
LFDDLCNAQIAKRFRRSLDRSFGSLTEGAAMPARLITDAFVRNVKPPTAEGARQVTYLHNIERGLSLVLVVSYGGTKTFRALTYDERTKKPRSRKLGTYPQMSVKQARAEARAYWENPAKFEAQEAVGSFQEIAEDWLKRHVQANASEQAPLPARD